MKTKYLSCPFWGEVVVTFGADCCSYLVFSESKCTASALIYGCGWVDLGGLELVYRFAFMLAVVLMRILLSLSAVILIELLDVFV